MRGWLSRILMFSVASGFLTACADQQPSAPDTTLDATGLAAAAVASGPCSLLKDIARDARSWFSQPEQNVAQDQVRTISSACKDGDQSAVASGAWDLLALMETTLDAGHAGDPAVGSSLVNALLACTASLCESLPDPFIPFDGALSSQGLFAVRSGSTEPVISRNAVFFEDVEGTAIAAWWGVAVDQPWSAVTKTDPVLVYGHPVTSNGLPLDEAGIGNIQYKLDVYPDAGQFVDGALHVGACFSPQAVYDDGTNLFEALMQRESVLLEYWTPTFCGALPAPLQSASMFGSLRSLVRTYVAPLVGMRTAKGATAVGGTPLDFSRFAPVAANTDGSLQFLTQPDPSPTEGQSIGTIRILALSGEGTPMERVAVTLSVLNNNGQGQGGASLSGTGCAVVDPDTGATACTGYTLEVPAGIVQFDDLSLGKPGGYTICATASLAGFTFARTCSDGFNVKNAN